MTVRIGAPTRKNKANAGEIGSPSNRSTPRVIPPSEPAIKPQLADFRSKIPSWRTLTGSNDP